MQFKMPFNWFDFKEFIYLNLIAIDQLANALTGGMPDETISSRSHRLNHIKGYRLAEIAINILFFPFQGWDHCKNAYLKEVKGRHLPEDFFELALRMNAEFDRRRAELVSQ